MFEISRQAKDWHRATEFQEKKGACKRPLPAAARPWPRPFPGARRLQKAHANALASILGFPDSLKGSKYTVTLVPAWRWCHCHNYRAPRGDLKTSGEESQSPITEKREHFGRIPPNL